MLTNQQQAEFDWLAKQHKIEGTEDPLTLRERIALNIYVASERDGAEAFREADEFLLEIVQQRYQEKQNDKSIETPP
jgi:hypothetical protein